MVIESVGGRAVRLEPRAVIVENVPRLIGVVKVQMWLRIYHNQIFIVYFIHLHHPVVIFLCFLQYFSVLFDQPLPVDLITKIVKFRVAEQEKKAKPVANDFPGNLSAPAQRALAGAGIKTVKQLAKHTEAEILALHGVGPSSIPKLKAALAEAGLSFKS